MPKPIDADACPWPICRQLFGNPGKLKSAAFDLSIVAFGHHRDTHGYNTFASSRKRRINSLACSVAVPVIIWHGCFACGNSKPRWVIALAVGEAAKNSAIGMVLISFFFAAIIP